MRRGGWWDTFEHAPPRPVADGLKARSRRGDFSRTWWGKRWIEALEGFGWETRLSRGRSYARRGQVADLEVTDGQVRAKVQGSRPKPYDVTIGLRPLAVPQWEAALQALAGQAAYAAQLLAGELPAEIDAIFAGAGASLFPEKSQDLIMDCSCPDWAVPCKHVAAVHYLLAEEIDREPFLLFALRGRDREAVTAALRQARGAAEPAVEPAASGEEPVVEPLPVEGFWRLGEGMEAWKVVLAAPAVPGSVLRRLGPPEFAEEPAVLEGRLAEIYASVTDRALEIGLAAAPAEEAE